MHVCVCVCVCLCGWGREILLKQIKCVKFAQGISLLGMLPMQGMHVEGADS